MNEHPNAAIIRSAYEAMEGQEGAGARVGQTGRHTFERATPVRGYLCLPRPPGSGAGSGEVPGRTLLLRLPAWD